MRWLLSLLLFRRPDIRGRTPRQWLVILLLSLVGGPFYHMIFSWSAGTGLDRAG